MKNAMRLAATTVAMTLIAGCASSKKSAATQPIAATTQPTAPVTAASLQEKVRPSLVVVRYTYDGETGRRDVEGVGIVLRDDGLIACASGIVPAQMPLTQMINFKVLVPPGVEGVDQVDYPAKFLGRDDRAELAYFKVDKAGKTWTPLTPVTDHKLGVGEPLFSVGLLPKDSGYSPFVRRTTVSALLRGPVPLVLTDGNLTSVGSPVFDANGDFVAIVPQQEGQNPLLNPDGDNDAAGLLSPPIFVVNLDFYRNSLVDPPTAPDARKVPWLGVVQMSGLTKEVAEVYGLKGKPAIQIGDVVAGGPADKAGLKSSEVVTQVNGHDLERGDVPDELPLILARQLGQMNVGDDVTLTIQRAPDAKPEQLTVKLGERPAQAASATRFYAEDLGFTTRDMVFNDRYARRLDENFGGVVTTFVKPQGNAQAGGLKGNDVITKLNQIDVTNVTQFKDAYEGFRKVSPKDAVVLEVLRGADTQIIRIQPPQ